MSGSKKNRDNCGICTCYRAFAGCGKKESVVGTWEGDDYAYTFNADGTGTQQIGGINVNISSYQAKDGKLSITVTYLGTDDTTEFTYTLKRCADTDKWR